MARRDAADVLRKARKVLETAELGLADLAGKDPRRIVSGWQNVLVFGRAVTFVLQNLRTIDEATFDAWYIPHRNTMSADPLLAYFNRLRSELEKEGGAEMTGALHVKGRNNVEYTLAHPSPGEPGFVIDRRSETPRASAPGVEVRKVIGSDLPAVRVRTVIEAPNPPREHLNQPIADYSAIGLARLYLAYLSRLVSEAETHFSNA